MTDSGGYIMDTRGFMCGACRQRLSKTVDGKVSPCQACNKLSPDRTNEKVNWAEHDKICPRRIREFAHRVKSKLFHNIDQADHQGSPYKSLNSNPAIELPEVRSRKRALLVGVSYKTWKYRLMGTINDVRKMRNWLIEKHGFRAKDIRVLTEEEPKPDLTPTKKNIQESLKWLVDDCQNGDSLVFYYSGHGLRQPDFSGDEVDGFDETLCPVDFLEAGMILDNDINSTIVWPLTKGVTLHAIVDACHSGTILDLVYVYNRAKKQWEDHSPQSGTRKHTSGGLAISISACEDNQVAADTSAFSEGNNEMSGAMTYLLIEIWKEHPRPTYGLLFEKMYELLDAANKSGCFAQKILRRVLRQRLLQKPLLSTSEKFDVDQRLFIL